MLIPGRIGIWRVDGEQENKFLQTKSSEQGQTPAET